MRAHLLSVKLSAILLSLSANFAAAQYVAPPVVGVPYDAPPATVIPRAGSIGSALTPPTYYRSAPQLVPTTVYRPVTAYHPVTGQPYTRWDAASTLDVETQRVATPLPGYGAPFAAYRPAAPVVQSFYRPATLMNVQGPIDPYTGNVVPGAVYSSNRLPLSVAPAYAVGRPVMSAPVVSYYGAWPFRRPAPVVVQQRPVVPVYTPAPAYSGAPYATNYVGPSYAAPAYAAPVYQTPVYSGQPAPGAVMSSPTYSYPSTSSPATSSPTYSDPYCPPGASSPSTTVPADSRPALGASSMTAPTDRSSTASTARPLVPAQEARSTTTKPQVNWPSFLPSRTRQPAPAAATDAPKSSEAAEPTAGRITEKKPASEYDPEVRPLRDPSARIPNLNDHRAPPLLDPRSAGVTAPIRRLTLTPSDNVTGHTANPAAR
jgi:hypothetical protein